MVVQTKLQPPSPTAKASFSHKDGLFSAGVEVYEGMIVGECAKNEDIVCNICKSKHLTNTRASGSDDALRLVPYTEMSLEQCMEFIKDDELLEVTPK